MRRNVKEDDKNISKLREFSIISFIASAIFLISNLVVIVFNIDIDSRAFYLVR